MTEVLVNQVIMHFGPIMIIVKESTDDPPLGVIIDVYAKGELIDSYTHWYSEYE